MGRNCRKCEVKHKGKTKECEYSEVINFIECINQIHNTEYKLTECPDEDEKK